MHGMHVFYNGMHNGMHDLPTECVTRLLRSAMLWLVPLILTERFVLRCWQHPLPMAERQVDFPACARCFAQFVLHAA